MLKIKTLKELIESKANKLGLSFDEVLSNMTPNQRFEKLITQIEKYASRNSLRADTRLFRLFDESEFINFSKTKFYVTPNEKDLLRYKKILLELYDNGVYHNNNYRFIIGKDTDNYKNLKYYNLDITNKSFNIYQKIMKYNIQNHNFYFIDHKEENLIKEYYTHFLKNNLSSDHSINEIHVKRFNQMLSEISPNIIECIFDHIRSIKLNYVTRDFTYDQVKRFFDTTDFSKRIINQSNEFKSKFTFDITRWHYSKARDLRITNLEELKTAINVYIEYLSKVNSFNRFLNPPDVSSEYIKDRINQMTMVDILEINKIIQSRINRQW